MKLIRENTALKSVIGKKCAHPIIYGIYRNYQVLFMIFYFLFIHFTVRIMIGRPGLEGEGLLHFELRYINS